LARKLLDILFCIFSNIEFRKAIKMERRNHQRYGVKAGTFAILRSTSIELSKIKDMSMGEIAFAVIKSKPIKMGQITNISKDGLAFHYIDRQNGSNSLFKMDILFAGEAFYLDRLLFKPVFDILVETEIPLNSFTIRKCGVQFGELDHRQRSQLEYFICNHTLATPDFKPALQPWNDSRRMLSDPYEMVESIV
jgi:hypothetical protein